MARAGWTPGARTLKMNSSAIEELELKVKRSGRISLETISEEGE
jgi:hypothetical protein